MNHKGTVKIETERLILRRFKKDDLEPMFLNCWSDPDVWKWTSYEQMNSIDDVLTLNNIFTDHWFARYEKLDWYSWVIQLKSTNEVIGRIRGMNPNDRIQQIELAYELGRNWWNQGYATEATKAVIGFFFNEVGLHRIYANHADENPASGRVMQKCGMVYEGTSREWCVCNAGRFDGLNYAILAKDYIKNQTVSPKFDENFWSALDSLITSSEIIIDRPKGSRHPKYLDYIYPLDYGYLENTSSMDGSGIDVWKGSNGDYIDSIICTIDLMKRDSEIKILIGCNEEEKLLALPDNKYMKGVLIRRNNVC